MLSASVKKIVGLSDLLASEVDAMAEASTVYSLNMNETITYNKNGTLPHYMQFTEKNLLAVIGYSILIVVGTCTNFMGLYLLRGLTPRTRIINMLIHLAIADLLVILVEMPLELAWAATVSWLAGNTFCKIMMFWRTFGLYLSSFILMCISIDRYCAVMRPLNLSGANGRDRLLLSIAWVGAGLASLPQSIVFHVEVKGENFSQCVSFDTMDFPVTGYVYFIFNIMCLYILPLMTFLFCYGCILCELARRLKDIAENRIRRNNGDRFDRAWNRTLKMTIVIVILYIVLWTPFHCINMWHAVDYQRAEAIEPWIQQLFWTVGLANSVLNPMVYGCCIIPTHSQRTSVRQSTNEMTIVTRNSDYQK